MSFSDPGVSVPVSAGRCHRRPSICSTSQLAASVPITRRCQRRRCGVLGDQFFEQLLDTEPQEKEQDSHKSELHRPEQPSSPSILGSAVRSIFKQLVTLAEFGTKEQPRSTTSRGSASGLGDEGRGPQERRRSMERQRAKSLDASPVDTQSPQRPRASSCGADRRHSAISNPTMSPDGLVWFSSGIWKQNSGVNHLNSNDFDTWRWRYFNLRWSKQVGLVLVYFSEKHDGKALACLIRGQDSSEKAEVRRLPPLRMKELSVEGREAKLAELRQHELIVRTRARSRTQHLPEELHRIQAKGVDERGHQRTLVLGFEDAEAAKALMRVVKAALHQHFSEDQ